MYALVAVTIRARRREPRRVILGHLTAPEGVVTPGCTRGRKTRPRREPTRAKYTPWDWCACTPPARACPIGLLSTKEIDIMTTSPEELLVASPGLSANEIIAEALSRAIIAVDVVRNVAGSMQASIDNSQLWAAIYALDGVVALLLSHEESGA
jgi:hypothetical protein